MPFFRQAHNFVIAGDNPNAPPPNIPAILAEVEQITQAVSSSLPSGSHFRGTLRPMDENTSRFLQDQLSQKDAQLRAMAERKARKEEAKRIRGMQYPAVGPGGGYATGNGNNQPLALSQAPQILPAYHPNFDPPQVMDPIMMPGTLPGDFPLQGVPFVPPGMNVPPQEFSPHHPLWEPNGYPPHPSYLPRLHPAQGAHDYRIMPFPPPSHIRHQESPYLTDVDWEEPDEGVALDEQSNPSSSRTRVTASVNQRQ